MGDGVDRPAVLAVQRHGLASDGFGLGVVARLLEAEGVHAEHEAVVRDRAVPVRQHPRHPVAQHVRVAEIEVAELGELDRRHVARMEQGGATPGLGRPLEVAVEPGARRGDVQPLAVVGLGDQGLGGRDALRELALESAVAGGRQHAGAERMGHDEVRMIGQDGVDLDHRIGLISVQQGDRTFQPAHGVGGRGGNGIAPDIGQWH